MKQIIITIGFSVIIIITSLIIWTESGKVSRKEELERAVSAAVKQTVSQSKIPNEIEIKSSQDMIYYFVQLLSMNLPDNRNVKVEVMGVSYKNGLLDILVSEEYKNFDGSNSIIDVRKSAIYE